jgi:hypothetical protein
MKMNDKERLVELLYDSNVRCDQKIEELADDVMDIITHSETVQELDGCEYCKEDSEGFRRMLGAFSLVNPFHGKTWLIHAGKYTPREIYFCPMCGRKLSKLSKGE